MASKERMTPGGWKEDKDIEIKRLQSEVFDIAMNKNTPKGLTPIPYPGSIGTVDRDTPRLGDQGQEREMIDTAKIAEITGIRDLEEPEIRGQWATWDQHGSKGLMDERVKRLKDEGYVAFFSARDRRWGVKV